MRGSPQASIDRHQYIPPQAQQAMDRQMQSLPTHLQRQMGDGAHMSSQARKAISDHMQKTMPSHLKQYAGAYMEQQVVNPGATVAPAASSGAPAPMPDRLRLDHSNVSAAQYDASFHNNLFAADSESSPQPQGQFPAPGQSVPPQQPSGAPPAGSGSPDYGFIMEPPKQEPPKFTMPGFSGGSPLIMRIGLVLGGLLLLIIVFAVGKSIFSGGGNTQALTDVAGVQQTMINVLAESTGDTGQQQITLSTANQTFAATAKISLTSSQQQLITYMTLNHKKIDSKALAKLTNPAIDQQLKTAASDSTYDSTFKQVMQDQLTKYEKALQTAYQQTTGQKGRKLLTEDFQGAQLLLTQLNGS